MLLKFMLFALNLIRTSVKDIKWNRTLRNPTLHGGKATDGAIRGSMASAQEQFRPAVEQYLRSTIGFKHALALSKPNDGLHQIWMNNFVEFDADPEAEFPEPPDVKPIADVVTTGVLPKGVELLNYQECPGGTIDSFVYPRGYSRGCEKGTASTDSSCLLRPEGV